MSGRLRVVRVAAMGCLYAGIWMHCARAAEPIPHAQDRPPNPAYSPAEAIRRMVVPPGFKVELVASEPDLVNPVAMTFDERGRIWVTESLEYPRRSAGSGKDRIKVLEDTDGDGKADKFTVFADGLNIPSGIAVGHGGVWVANSPDLLLLKDTDGDGKADAREVIVTGFGRDDTHELPNSLSWGPDGWLYGWNGVFNQSHVAYRGKTYDFTCAIFRINPRTRDFELFCEGTSNPWGIAWDNEGSTFASACVIDHLWHLTESGYYHRQGGPYPPYTWKIESIVDHNHQKAAYCGIHFYDSDAYPTQFRERLFMGNIHGNCVNVDRLTRSGSTYRGARAPDFLTANDAWFMPVSQKTGPDGSIYILDWYDRYHCYQDANRDPTGIDRLKGRLYRVRYGETPRPSNVDIGTFSGKDLIALLASPNGYKRETARRLLTERTLTAEETSALEAMAFDETAARRTRMNALWTRLSRGPLEASFHARLLAHADPGFRAWGVRAAGNQHQVSTSIRETVVALAKDAAPDVLLQVAIAARKVEGIDARTLLVEVASNCGPDSLIPHIVWQNVLPLLNVDPMSFVRAVDAARRPLSAPLLAIAGRALEPILANRQGEAAASLLALVLHGEDDEAKHLALDSLSAPLREFARAPKSKNDPRGLILEVLQQAKTRDRDLSASLLLARAYFRDQAGLAAARQILESGSRREELRLRALDALVSVDASAGSGPPLALSMFDDPARRGSLDFRGKVLSALGGVDDPRIGRSVVAHYPTLEPVLKPRAIELLTQRGSWSLDLLKAVVDGKIPAQALNQNQVRKLLASRSPEVAALARAKLAMVRETRNPQREQVIGEMRDFLKKTPGDPVGGAVVFQRVCAQCHKIHGEGQEVGPEITLNGRSSYEQLLSNVFDPSLVIGAAYQATTVATADGRVLTGLLVEDSPERVVLKLQGGKIESLARANVEERKVSVLSLMPEDLEKQLKPQELADLFSYITLDRPPSDPAARPIPGAQALPRKPVAR